MGLNRPQSLWTAAAKTFELPPPEPPKSRPTSQAAAKDFFDNQESLTEIYGKVEKIIGCKIDPDKTYKLIDPKSINGKGGHLVISAISGDGADGGKSDDKKYHLKLVLKNEGVSIEHQFAEIAYYLMYQNFGYGPKTAVLMHKDSLIFLLEDANNPLPDKGSASFRDFKKIKESGQQSEIEEKLTSSKADLYAIEILTLILATGDIFQKPDNYGVRIIDTDGITIAIPFVVDLLPPPLRSYVNFCAKIGASRYCEDFDNPKKYAKLIADLLLKSFDPKVDQREVMAISDFHIFEYFKDDKKGQDIMDLMGGLNIILSDEFDEKINQAFDDSLKHLDDYCLASKTIISEEHKNLARKIIEERRNFILSVAEELRKHPEIQDVMSNEWHPGKYPQTGRSVGAENREKPLGAGDEFFPSPPQPHRVAKPKVVDDSLKPKDLLLGKRSFSALDCGLVNSEGKSQRLRVDVEPVSASPLQEKEKAQPPSPR